MTRSTLVRLALHGGAGPYGGEALDERQALREIASVGADLLASGRCALDVVTEVVELLEQSPYFNAGVGAALNRDGSAELDAAVMDGRSRRCGAVGCVRHTRSPVRGARALMDDGRHVLLVAEGADAFARDAGLPAVDPAYFVTARRQVELAEALREHTAPRGHGTVGAVARDAHGHLAAATSTGGLTGKLPGRMGDSALIGSGTFADDETLAISCTGSGESFIRAAFAAQVHCRLQSGAMTLEHACREALEQVARYGGDGGCIAIDASGTIAMPFNSAGMYRAWLGGDGMIGVAVDEKMRSQAGERMSAPP